MNSSKPGGARLLKAWAAASILYVGVAGGLSAQPIRAAIAEARQPAPPPLPQPPPRVPTGPIPDPPDTPAVKLAKTVAKQAAIVIAPPLLVLWFGWDVWFAVVGFLSRDRGGRDDS